MDEGPNLLTGSGALEGDGHGIGHARRCHDLLRTDWLDALHATLELATSVCSWCAVVDVVDA